MMLRTFREQAIQECYRLAGEARRTADAATDPDTISDFLQFERQWLFVARSYEASKQ